MFTAAVITISDKGAIGERIDTSGPNLVSILKEHEYDVVYTTIIPDDFDTIKEELCKCSDELGVTLVLTTGGTGFSPRDITPEATMAVVERPTPGIPEAMRAESMRITPKGCLSRSAAGIRKRTLIINLPGSKKASQENILAVIDAVDHGLEMLQSAGSANCGG
ncbi:MAG: MogA/MoaB family molybdenum cofactor biosynthesis protein [Oscillospiraceae bacterium]|nr:MogA/MoaB family molybdenum cofactor biosynthesis protein [Oscillospiraceae bacterium]